MKNKRITHWGLLVGDAKALVILFTTLILLLCDRYYVGIIFITICFLIEIIMTLRGKRRHDCY